jgi:AcrR family transcriptional regulator
MAYTWDMARGLNVDLVVTAAIELADEEGLAAVTMARVAKRCGFTTMSLYRHVASKDELVTRMLDRALGIAPAIEIPDWRTGLERWGRELLAVIMRHPWGIDVPITGMLGTEAQLSWLDRGLETLADTRLSEAAKAEVVLLVNGYVFWGARLAFQVPEDADVRFVPEGFDLGRYPSLARAVQGGVFEDDTPLEEQFDRGLQWVLDGVAGLADAGA